MKDKSPKKPQFVVGFLQLAGQAENEELTIALCAVVEKFLSNQDFRSKFYRLSTIESASQVAAENLGNFILFSNCPPNSAYDNKPLETNKTTTAGDKLSAFPADSYDKSKQGLAKLLSEYPQLELHIITGASDLRLSNFELTSLSPQSLITVQRKVAWLSSKDYAQEFANCLVNRLRVSITKALEFQTYDRSHLFLAQFSKLEIHVLSEDDKVFAKDVITHLEKACGPQAFRFEPVRDLEAIHNLSLTSPIEFLFVTDRRGTLSGCLDTLVQVNPRMVVFYIGCDKPLPFKHPNLISFLLKAGANTDFRVLLDAFVAAAERLLVSPSEGDVVQQVLRHYYELLGDASPNDFYSANRYIVRNLHRLLDGLREMQGMTFYAPFDSVTDLEKYAHILPFIAPYSVVTYTGVADLFGGHAASGVKSGDPIAIQSLWESPRRNHGFVAPGALHTFLKDHARLFHAGNVQFVPSPMVTRLLPDNVTELNPEASQVVAMLKGVPYWGGNKEPQNFFPAASVGAQFAYGALKMDQLDDVRLLAQVQIPYLQSSKPNELAKLLADEEASIRAFRNHVSEVIADCNRSVAVESRSKILRRFTREVKDGVALLDDRMGRLKRTNRIALAAASVLTAGVSISTVFGIPFPEGARSIAGSGGTIGVLTSLLNYINQVRNLEQEKFHFLWRLSLKNDSARL